MTAARTDIPPIVGDELTAPLPEEIVRLAYQLLLGRSVESEQALRSHMALGSVSALRRTIMSSAEFRHMMDRLGGTRASKWVATDVHDRYTMWVDLSDRFVSSGCLENNWEPSESQYVASRLHSGDVVLDIGANVGWFSLLAAKCIGRAGRVHAFEPRPQTAAMLRRTIADNALRKQVSVWEFALSDQAGDVTLQWERGTDNPGHTFLAGAADSERGDLESARATAVVLDEFLPDVAPDFVKIDVEGAEPKALAGARNALLRRRPAIISELYPEQLQSVSGVTASRFIAQLEELGYMCFRLEDGRPTNRLWDFPSDATKELVSIVFEYSGHT